MAVILSRTMTALFVMIEADRSDRRCAFLCCSSDLVLSVFPLACLLFGERMFCTTVPKPLNPKPLNPKP